MLCRECIIRCLVAPEPAYMEKNIFLCDDGHAKTDGPRKRAMVEELRILGNYLCWFCCRLALASSLPACLLSS